ncbi:hypothetical protein C2S53_010318 [Perilla frutescens var. hirtella]|uniref:Uncharacterized protein n=1 Tax=Perilla frutescens var. hirtella TaxID=608512 RepID=A0AAD4ITF6_PERFH|nr:hypothetical protein C2S53_010318 [Perilla frutescens var. hirtella]
MGEKRMNQPNPFLLRVNQDDDRPSQRAFQFLHRRRSAHGFFGMAVKFESDTVRLADDSRKASKSGIGLRPEIKSAQLCWRSYSCRCSINSLDS